MRFRALFFAVAFSLAAGSAVAEIPHETLEQIAQIRVEIFELRHLNKIAKLSGQELHQRTEALKKKEKALWETYRREPRDNIQNARTAIDGLVKARLALLTPRWAKEEREFREGVREQKKETALALEDDARRAVDIQRQRLLLERERDSGAIDRETFAQKDQAALDSIADLRKKYEEAGGMWPKNFDQRLAFLTKALDDKLETQLPPKIPAAKPVQAEAPAPREPSREPSIQRPPTPVPGGNAGSGYSTIFFVLAILCGGAAVWWYRKRKRVAPAFSGNYGTAAWAAWRQQPISRHDVLRGVSFGKSSHPDLPPDAIGAPVASMPEAHTLIVARTRAGKGTRVIVPTLLRYGGSMLVIDPKGENAAITARTRRDQLSQTVHIVNPWAEKAKLYEGLGFQPATFNPLDAIDRNDPNAVAVAQSLAAIICPAGEGKEKYWQGSAANVLTGVFLWIADQPDEQKTLARAREIVTTSRADFTKVLVKMAASTAYHGAVKEMVSQYIDLADETYSGIMSNLAENTKFLSDPRIKAATASSSFSMKAFRDLATTVYLVIPHDRVQTHATWLRLVIAAAMQGLKSRSDATAPHHRCMFLIDEFGSIGRIDDIPRDIALMSGYGLDFTLIVQGLDQLKHHYGEARGTILSNCAYKWFCFVNELETAKYLSESLGKKTVGTEGKSFSAASNSGGISHTTGETHGEMGRSLLMPDEILNLGREVAILLNPHGAPCYLRPVDYWKLPGIYAHLQAEYGHFYWDPPLAYDENPYFKGPQPPPRSGDGRMSRAEALSILGFEEGVTESEIAKRYDAMMTQVQPDEGHLARKISEAKAALLGE